jgi:hypothetical protein
LKPGVGYIENIEIDMIPRSRDQSIPTNSPLMAWIHYLMDATASFQRPLAYNEGTQELLERQGFVDIKHEVIEIPLNPWASDPHAKDIGRWYNLGLTQGVEALTMAPMTRMRRWQKEDVDRMVQEVKRDICSRKMHAFCYM